MKAFDVMKGKGVLVGGILPRLAADRLSLLVASKETTKAKMIADLLVKELDEAPDDETLALDFAKKLIKNWNNAVPNISSDDMEESWNAFLEEVRRDVSRRVAPRYIESIIESVTKLRRRKANAERKQGS